MSGFVSLNRRDVTVASYMREQGVQRILHELRALTTDNRAIPAAARNLLFFFLLPPFFRHLPPSPFSHPSSRSASLYCPLVVYAPTIVLLLPLLSPSFSFGLVRQEKSSVTRRRRVSTRAAAACTRRYASSSTFVTSPFVPLLPPPRHPRAPSATFDPLST